MHENHPGIPVGHFSDFRQALCAPAQGIALFFRNPRLIIWPLIPLLIAMVIDGTALGALVPWIRNRIELLLPQGTWYWSAVGWTVDAVLNLVFFIFAALLFVITYVAVSGPFNEFLSERIERIRSTARLPETAPGILGPLVDGLRQAALLTVLALPALLLTLIPLIGPPLFALWTILLLGFSFYEIPLSRRGIPFSEKRKLARRRIGAIMGLGTAVFVLSIVPLGQILFMPSFVAGGTLVFILTGSETSP